MYTTTVSTAFEFFLGKNLNKNYNKFFHIFYNNIAVLQQQQDTLTYLKFNDKAIFWNICYVHTNNTILKKVIRQTQVNVYLKIILCTSKYIIHQNKTSEL